MATIQFKGKIQTVYNVDDSHAFDYIQVPELTAKHCNMAEFRVHPKYGSYANSDLFKGILRRIKENIVGKYSSQIRLDKIPAGVQIDTSGFLAVVTIEV